MSTFCPPTMVRLGPTVREPSVVVPVPPLATVKALVKLSPAKVGVEVVVRFWLSEELPNRVRVLELPLMVIPLITELLIVELEARSPEMVEVEIVEVAIVEDVMELVPVNVVLPPCKVKVLPFKAK